jgi:hypothetical protein
LDLNVEFIDFENTDQSIHWGTNDDPADRLEAEALFSSQLRDRLAEQARANGTDVATTEITPWQLEVKASLKRIGEERCFVQVWAEESRLERSAIVDGPVLVPVREPRGYAAVCEQSVESCREKLLIIAEGLTSGCCSQ